MGPETDSHHHSGPWISLVYSFLVTSSCFTRWACGAGLFDVHLMRKWQNEGTCQPGQTTQVIESGYPRYRTDQVQLNRHAALGPVARGVFSISRGPCRVCKEWLKDRAGQSSIHSSVGAVRGVPRRQKATGEGHRRTPLYPRHACCRSRPGPRWSTQDSNVAEHLGGGCFRTLGARGRGRSPFPPGGWEGDREGMRG